jgi:hypothetical protein
VAFLLQLALAATAEQTPHTGLQQLNNIYTSGFLKQEPG